MCVCVCVCVRSDALTIPFCLLQPTVAMVTIVAMVTMGGMEGCPAMEAIGPTVAMVVTASQATSMEEMVVSS